MSVPRVLMYHGFCTDPPAEDPWSLFVRQNALQAQLALLADRPRLDLDGYLGHLASPAAPRGSVLVTIDDGYRSVLTVAAPLFAAAGIRPVLFVSPALVTDPPSAGLPGMGREPLLTPDELRALPAYGVELGVHGLDHSTMAGMTDAELHAHTAGARDRLADLTGTQPRSFAYPLGVLDDRAARAVSAAGYAVAFSVDRDYGRWGVPRTGIAAADSTGAFRFKLSPWYDVTWRATRPVTGLRHHVRPVLRLLDRMR